MAPRYKEHQIGGLSYLALSVVLAACGPPMSETDREIARAKKELAKAERKLEREKRKNPGLFVEDGRYLKAGIDDAISKGDWARAIERYKSLKAKDVDLTSYNRDFEARLNKILQSNTDLKLPREFHIYTLLSNIDPDNADYAEQAAAREDSIMSVAKLAEKSLRKEYDKVDGITWYYHPKQTTGTGAYLYIGQSEDSAPWLRLRVRYTSARNWLFAERVIAWHDGNRVPLISGVFERRNISRVWEWMDVSPSPTQLELLEALSKADESILRFEGDNGSRDHTLNATEKTALAEMLENFAMMLALHQIETAKAQ